MIRFLLLIFLSLVLSTGKANAHPMGNFSINHYSGLEIGSGEIKIRYLLDFAEVPTFQEIQEIDRDENGERSPSEQETYLARKTEALASNLILTVAGKPLPLIPTAHEITFPPGAGGLPTMRLLIVYRAAFPSSVAADSTPVDLTYRDQNYLSRAGWKEMTATGRDGTALINSSLPTRGSELKVYPDGEIQSPPQIIETQFSFALGSMPYIAPSTPETAGAVDQPLRNDRFTALMTGAAPTGPMLLLALAISFGLGALHALSPGHGKTIVAAYLVGARGTARHAFLLGGIVTASHTIGVFLLGFITLYLSKYIVPERLYPWLGLLSGLGIVIIGFSLFRKRWQAMGEDHTDHHPPHPHAADHHHHGHDHGHDHPHAPTLSGLLGLGISGGIVPCPSALVVLLSAIAFHQVGFGLVLILAFSAGLAATLVAIGLLMVYLRGMMGRFNHFGPLRRLLPVLSAAGVTLLGGAIAIGAWIQ
jgi:ABC-type nickel/cobalt efflux system permease component RcnA